MKAKELQKTIKKELKYTIRGFIWNSSRRGANRKVKCGFKSQYGYTKINIKGKNYREDYLVWVLFMGYFPDKIIHIDGNRSNNRLGNLKNVKSINNLKKHPKNSKDIKLLREVCFERFYYKDGDLFFKDYSPFRGKSIGHESKGYYICNIDNKPYLKHRLIYLMFYGELPELLDHIDRNPLNNRIENLRSADKKINSINRDIQPNNTSGHKGVSWNKKSNKFEAYIKVKGKKIYLKSHILFEDAVKARKKAEEKYWKHLNL